MQKYKNLSGQSEIVAYEIGTDYIIVQFVSGRHTLYTYTFMSAGSHVVEAMKELAGIGHGLNAYISTNNPDYNSRS